MTPLVFITGVLLGTCASIAFGLLVVMLLFWLLGASEPQVASEWSSLWRSALVFLVMTALCAVSFISLVKRRRGRLLAQGLMWLGLAATVAYYVLP
jgi:cytochrome bd-type quinol oxidase subunit 2